MSLLWIIICLYARLFDGVAPLGMQNDDATLDSMSTTLVLADYGVVLEKHGSVVGKHKTFIYTDNI